MFQVVDLETESPERAAFSLIVRGAKELHDHVYTFCLAASFTATAAVASGKCPESVESAVVAATSRRPSVKEIRGSPVSSVHDKVNMGLLMVKKSLVFEIIWLLNR